MTKKNYLISDEFWAQIEPFLPIVKTIHTLGTHRKRVDNSTAVNTIFFALRAGCQ